MKLQFFTKIQKLYKKAKNDFSQQATWQRKKYINQLESLREKRMGGWKIEERNHHS